MKEFSSTFSRTFFRTKLLFAIFVLLVVSACATQSGPEAVSQNAAVEEQKVPFPQNPTLIEDEYRIGAQDLLEVEVFQVEDFSITIRVNNHGFINLPLVGEIKAAGLTNDELEKLIAKKLDEDYLQNPHVTVFIKEFTSQRITVEGSVNQPGVFPIKGRTTLMQAIATAQGLTNLAKNTEVQLYRVNEDGTKVTYIYDIDSIRSGESEDPEIKGDDLIIVHRSKPKTFIKNLTDTLRGFIFLGTVGIGAN